MERFLASDDDPGDLLALAFQALDEFQPWLAINRIHGVGTLPGYPASDDDIVPQFFDNRWQSFMVNSCLVRSKPFDNGRDTHATAYTERARP